MKNTINTNKWAGALPPCNRMSQNNNIKKQKYKKVNKYIRNTKNTKNWAGAQPLCNRMSQCVANISPPQFGSLRNVMQPVCDSALKLFENPH